MAIADHLSPKVIKILLQQGTVIPIILCQKPMLHMRRNLRTIIKIYPSDYLQGYCLLRLQ